MVVYIVCVECECWDMRDLDYFEVTRSVKQADQTLDKDTLVISRERGKIFVCKFLF